jgi:hypothetical protein
LALRFCVDEGVAAAGVRFSGVIHRACPTMVFSTWKLVRLRMSILVLALHG